MFNTGIFFPMMAGMAISLAITVPFSGVLVRYRANYNPKGLQLDGEGGAVPHTGPIVKSYFTMFGRVYRLEGWPGLYKGLMPTALSAFVVSLIIITSVETETSRHGRYRAPETGVFGTLIYSLALLVLSLPTSILTYRAITTPHRLPYFNPGTSLRMLLTPTERRKPWILYLTPGLMAAEVVHIAIVILFMGPIRRALIPSLAQNPQDISAVKVAIYVAVLGFSSLLLTPLEVIATRLAIQRNHANAEEPAPENQPLDVDEYPNADEDVIGLRQEDDPYLGLVDCAKRMVDEEGWITLYRAWWLTLMGGLMSAVA
ncbi:hypothetical protein CPB83DRAFT_852536 [Crepidotus variabilis]|uniref:Mitochondrial carrier n=1 Tax=Crepidotus variabilis TaxID=179855 RepID=A0A9P6EGV6_9AGAR|nr:hypothetical protein CPB83DRAFT_852536 [Crepidotus variabilis]